MELVYKELADVLYWHWSPNNGWYVVLMNASLCYVLAASGDIISWYRVSPRLGTK
jgi:hypothetical protein